MKTKKKKISQSKPAGKSPKRAVKQSIKLKTIEYSSNNSGGRWWLKDEDWKKLEEAGWTIGWCASKNAKIFETGKDGRWLGTLATSATIQAESIAVARALWEHTLCYTSTEEGCPCCGNPHNFYEQ